VVYVYKGFVTHLVLVSFNLCFDYLSPGLFSSLEWLVVQLIPQITQIDLYDSEMASNVVYPLKLFNSMFSNND